MSISYGLIIELLRNKKQQKYKTVLSQYTNHLHKLLVPLNFAILTVAMLISFSARFLNMYKARTTFYLFWQAGPAALTFYRSVLVRLQSWLGMLNAGWLIFMWSEIFFQIKFIIFQGFPTDQAAFLPG